MKDCVLRLNGTRSDRIQPITQMKKATQKVVKTGISLPPDLFERMEKEAEKQHRKVSNLIAMVYAERYEKIDGAGHVGGQEDATHPSRELVETH
jgi:hypothetical protein